MKKTSYLKLLTIPVFGLFVFSLFSFGIQTDSAAFTTSTYNCSIPLTRTNWNSSTTLGLGDCSLQKFDTALGELTQVNLVLNGNIESEVGLENTDTAPQTVTSNVSANISIQRPDNSVFDVILPTFNRSDDLPATDGVLDFGGTSGITIPGLTAADSDNLALTSASDLTLFSTSTGGVVEFVDITAIATGVSNFSASANLATFVNTYAAVSASVSYTYQAHDLGVTITDPNITAGEDNKVCLDVVNLENVASVGPTTIVISLPDGVVYISSDNPSWVGIQTGNTLTLTSPDPIAPGTTEVCLNLNFGPNVPNNQPLAATISGPQFDYNPSNNSDATNLPVTYNNSNPPAVLPPDPAVLGASEVVATSPSAASSLIRSGGFSHEIVFTVIFLIICGLIVTESFITSE